MNRSWIAKLSRAICPAIVGTLVLSAWASVQAAPLGIIKMEGRKQGASAWSSSLVVAPGDVIEYRLLADMAPVGTVNGTREITSTDASGFQSLSLDITQDASAGIQVDFTSVGELMNGWELGTPGANPGVLKPRGNGAGDDLTAIRPLRPAGTFSGVDEEVIHNGGTFTVGTAPGGAATDLSPKWGPATGAMRINGAGQVFLTASAVNGADPILGFTPLALQAVPEPSTIALGAMGLVGLVAFARRRRSA